MRNLQEYPITMGEVIKFLDYTVIAEDSIDDAMGNPLGDLSPLHARTALSVVKAASVIVQNDIGSEAARLLNEAFNSQNLPVREIELVD